MHGELEKFSEAIERDTEFAFSIKAQKINPWTNIKTGYVCFESSGDCRSISDMLNIQSQYYHCGLQECIYIGGLIYKEATTFLNNFGPLQLLCKHAATLEVTLLS